MLNESNSGRAFDSALSFYLWIGLVVIALALWLWGKYELRQSDETGDDDADKD